MQNDILVTGLGIISAIGNSVAENLGSLLDGKTGIGPMVHLETAHKDVFRVGEVKLSNEALFERLGIAMADRHFHSRTSLLALAAAREALQDAGLEPEVFGKKRIGIISATTVGGMDKTENNYASRNVGSGFIQTHPSGDSTERVAKCLNIEGYRTTLSTACSSAANAMMHGARLIKHGVLDMVLVGGVDPLSRFTLNGFNSLMILDQQWCRPFDEQRKGLNLGEGAGFLVIESVGSAQERNAKIYCKLAGYANANDAYHQTASSPEGDGATISMNRALEMSGLDASDIDYINVHGTGTSNNDMSEGVALKRIFGNKIPPFSSTKSYTGHTLGAAAGIEAVFSVLAIEHGVLFPNLNFRETIRDLAISPITELAKDRPVRHVLSNSFGFGGNNSTLIFSK
ncbi:MAG: beta-ketoacyl-[acyl-carrier-protein] synthase family protein [Breznakibacter sp.]